MAFFLALILGTLLGWVDCVEFEAHINMAGVKGLVTFDSTQRVAIVNLTRVCNIANLNLALFPVMYSHAMRPCEVANTGARVYTFSVDKPFATVNVSTVFERRPFLDDLSLVVESCNFIACAVIRQKKATKTWQARFFDTVAGDVYIRQNDGERPARILSNLVSLRGKTSVIRVNIFMSSSAADNCQVLLSALPADLIAHGELRAGSPGQPANSRIDIADLRAVGRFILLQLESTFKCAMVMEMEKKQVHALVDMKGVKGVFTFTQASPFDTTQVAVNLTGLRNRTGPYHVHEFPLPQMLPSPEGICSNDNVGGHWNPFQLNTQGPAYPKDTQATHDMYEVGDLSGRHGSLASRSNFEMTYEDWNLPLFGTNSIVGRSVVIHQPNGARLVCASIGYPGEVVVAKSVFRAPVVGTVFFIQLRNNVYSDVSVFMDLSYANASTAASQNHNWHIHHFPIRSEMDSDSSRCASTAAHWNPFSINIADNNYALDCNPGNPFACEIGDLTGKHQLLNLSSNAGKFEAKHFYTDTTSWATATDSMVGRSVVIHEANGAAARLACANITAVQLPAARTTQWFGAGTSQGRIHFSQKPEGLTVVNISLSNLNRLAGGFHVHILPVKNRNNPCSDENIMGHFNPFNVNQSASPPPGSGTSDEYEIGDISGKSGMLTDLNQYQKQYTDSNMPLSGVNSVIGRSIVIHFRNGSRLQCANIAAEDASQAEWLHARANFNGLLRGSITLSQQVFADGSYSDCMIEVDIQAQLQNVTEAHWLIYEGHKGGNGSQCVTEGSLFNPFRISQRNPTCSPAHPLHCEVGDLTSKLGAVKLAHRQFLTETGLQLAGDFTVVSRSVVLRNGSMTLGCADILSDSASALLIFPKVTSFSRSDFRSRVGRSLDIPPWRVTIIPAAHLSEVNGKCQQASFLVAGSVSTEKLNLIHNNPIMGPYRRSNVCSGDASSTYRLTQAWLPELLTMAVAQLLLGFLRQ